MIEALIAMTIAYEASNQSLKCQQWVARTIEVRAEERHMTPREVVLTKHQFSCWKDGQPTQKRILTDKELATAMKAWATRGTVVERPNLYCDDSVTPSWTKSPKVKFLKQIGRLRFYREER